LPELPFGVDGVVAVCAAASPATRAIAIIVFTNLDFIVDSSLCPPDEARYDPAYTVTAF
jgi:hypothetical protein